MTDCIIVGNIARGGSGGTGIAGGDASGGGISVGTNAYFGFVDVSVAVVSDSLIMGNIASRRRGRLRGRWRQRLGGGLMVVGSVPTERPRGRQLRDVGKHIDHRQLRASAAQGPRPARAAGAGCTSPSGRS